MPAPLLASPSILDFSLSGAELERAARLLQIRARRETASAFAGGYRSAFHGSGIEFEESRPYVPGDDVRGIDWNVLARTGQPFVKRYREERDLTVWLAMDVSGSMRFGSLGRAKTVTAAHAAALICIAAIRSGDRVGLLSFDERIRDEIAPARGEGHARLILRALLAAPGRSGGGTGLEAAIGRVRRLARRRSAVFLLSDFRDDAFFQPAAGRPPPRAELVALAREHDVLALPIHDPREEEIPAVGSLRLADPERPERRLVLATRRSRERYRAACAVRRRALVHRLRADGVPVLPLRTDRDALLALSRHFQGRHGRRRNSR